MLRAVIFDLDQTLINTLSRFYRIFNLVLQDFGGEVLDWNTFIKHYADDTLNQFIPENVSVRVFWRIFLHRYNDIELEDESPIPGAIDVLRKLKELGVKVAIVTGRAVDEDCVWRELKHHGMADYVDCVVTCKGYVDGELFSKVEVLRKAAECLGVSINDCVVVGDYWPDIRSGKIVNAKLVVGVLTGFMSRDELLRHGADVVLDSVADLLNVLSSYFVENLPESSF